MLEPDHRRLLLDSLQPPEGCRLDWAVATTYSLDLTALLVAPVAFAFAECQDRAGRPVADPLALLKAFRQYADRICLFCQAGQIHVPRTHQPLLQSLEDSVVETLAPRGGSFHPKLWFLRYVGDEEVQYRVLCQSRNLTFDRSWDTLLRLDGQLLDRTNAIARNHPLGDFVAALPGMAVELSPAWRERLQRLAYELRRVEFKLPEPFDGLAFWPLGIGDKPSRPFADAFANASRGIVISPFVDDGFLTDLTAQAPETPIELVSRLESLSPLQPASTQRLAQLWVLDDLAAPEPADLEEQTVDEPLAELPLIGLHAKLYFADVGNQSHMWTGSANATRAGFQRNVEFLVELRGPKKSCGIDALLGDGTPSTGKMPNSFRQLLRPFVPGPAAEAVDESQRAFEQAADEYARALSAARPTARCEPTDTANVFAISIAASQPITVAPPEGSTLRTWPISLSPAVAQTCSPTSSPWTKFEAVSLAGVTAFFAFELTSVDARFAKRFVLRIPLVAAPANRREHLLRTLLSDPQRVLRFLLLLLLDHRDPGGGNFVSPPESGESSSPLSALLETTLLESLLRSLARDPERLDDLASVLDDLRASPDGAALLPPELDSIWQPVWTVRQRQRAVAESTSKAAP